MGLWSHDVGWRVWNDWRFDDAGFWGLVIFLIVVAVRRFTNGNNAPNQPDALDILRDRFAKGEIDEEEFQKRKSTLES